MYTIFFYEDKAGNAPVLDYIRDLAAQGGKDAAIKRGKIRDYIKVLSAKGTLAGEPYIKHISGDIWELRPLRDRIFFAAWNGDGFVLLHHFMKKSKKTPAREIRKAEKELADLKERSGEDG